MWEYFYNCRIKLEVVIKNNSKCLSCHNHPTITTLAIVSGLRHDLYQQTQIQRQTVSWNPGYLRYWAVLLQTARSHRDMTGFALGLDRFVTSGIFFWSPHFSRLRVHVLTKGLTEGWWDSLDTVWTGLNKVGPMLGQWAAICGGHQH